MEGHLNCAPCSSKEPNVLDVKPIRTLSPMFPSSLGFNTAAPPPDAPPFVCVTPFGSFGSGSSEAVFPSNLCPLFPTFPSPHAASSNPFNTYNGTANGSVHATPMATVAPLNEEEPFFMGSTSASGRKIKRPIHLAGYQIGGSETKGSDEKQAKIKKPKKIYDHDVIVLPSSPHDARESVEVILMTFDGLRRRLLQLDEVKDMNRRPDLKVGNIMMNNELRVNMTKRIGNVPGIDVGDIFYFRIEMCLIGLHCQSMAGIDCMSTRFGNEVDSVAVGIVSSGGYDNEDEDVDILVYSGQGGASKNEKKQMDDQKLERGNLALERSLHRGNEIRVIRSAKDFTCPTGKIYVYDGIYKVRESWVEKGKSGFNIFKFKLIREPGQPDGIAVWRMTQKWKENPSSRGRVILPDISSGAENIPVCLVNEVDDEKGPSHFTYVTSVKYPFSFMKPLQGCACQSVCLPGDANCSCAQQNGGDLPYSSNGLLVSRKPLIYECSGSCPCTVNCRNRVTQKGIRLHFEVFRTRDRGWGLRSWDPIRAGTFICEYTGEVIDKTRVEEDGEEDEYIFQTHADDKAFKWNYIPELLGEPSSVESSEISKPLPIIISAKNMGNLARFMNHSCSPNVFWQPVQHNHGDEGYPHIMFFAIKHIPPMTELTYDYGLSRTETDKEDQGIDGRTRRTKKCLCGTSKCRGLFG